MSFKFKARVLLELGAELISSDAVALYELVKNAIDAGSKNVKIRIRIALQHSAYKQLRALLQYESNAKQSTANRFDAAKFNATVVQSLDDQANTATRERFLKAYGEPNTAAEALKCLDQAYTKGSYIVVIDEGCGMSARSLEDGYLTVGTPNRLLEKNAAIEQATTLVSRLRNPQSNTAIPLGEKGIGRLSAMRLGHYVKVKTKTAGLSHWNVLQLDWRPAFADPTLDASALSFPIETMSCDVDEIAKQGTSIYIRDLQSDWSEAKVKRIAEADLAKIADPFAAFRANKFMSISVQDLDISIPVLDREPLRYADALCTAKFSYDESGEPQLALRVDYKTHSREYTDHLKDDHLRACVREEPGRKKKKTPLIDAEIVAEALKHLGPWELEFYWFNRGRIMRETPELWHDSIQGFLAQWAGGFLVYRDGYRVYPYGERSDDWLDLDRKALAASAYKLNRAQMVGRLRISSIGNPSLLDQTNREGFRDSYDREALVRLLRYVILGFCRPFLEQVERDSEPPIEEVAEEVQQRLTTSRDIAVASLKGMQLRLPDEEGNIRKVMHHLEEVSEAWERAKLRIASFEETIDSFVHLAGVGLMLEFVAHELSRVTQDSLKAVSSGKSSLQVVEAQLKTLDKRVRILDELSVPGRQIRKEADLRELVDMLCEFHRAKSVRHDVEIEVTSTSNGKFVETLERGQFLQILDNLFSNSFYWLTNRFDSSVPGKISIELNPRARTVRFADNGPGIPTERRESVFDQFVTTKPPREGRGLGLYIARRLAVENGARLYLDEAGADDVHRVFVLDFNKNQ
ncbi:sensor histidine kinase [Ralstonia pseudosolanacearum]|uniref:sensor histidine kinase n=1 Tax=Ralstonia pseudosolanacearum TaxID=1310165 RepID=UPI003D02C86B